MIEGDIIVGGDTKVYLSLLRALDSKKDITYVTAARVWVQSDKDEEYSGIVTRENGKPPFFLIDTRQLSLDRQYKLCVTLHESMKSFESALLTPLATPEIGTIEYFVNEAKTAVDFVVSTYADNNASRYYKWRFIEDFEIVAIYHPHRYYDPRTDKIVPYPTDPLLTYCWDQTESTSILIAKTDHLESNVIFQQELTTIFSGSYKICELYSMELFQMSISKEAYSYWENLRKNTGEIGGLFSPQPSEMQGNIRCTSDQDTKVLGFICAVQPSVQRVFVSKDDLRIHNPNPCPFFDWLSVFLDPPTDRELYDDGWRVATDPPRSDREWVWEECVDCTKIGTKNKPSFWPNDHL